MKKILFVFTILSIFIFSCSNADDTKAKEAEEAIKTEIIALDSLSTELDATIEGIEQSKAELEDALNDLE